MISLNKSKQLGGQLIKCISRTYSSKTTSYETLSVSNPKPYVFHVELNRPKNLNSFNNVMWREIPECFNALNDNSECRAIVLSAQGKHFTAGIDLNSMLQWGQKLSEFDDVARKSKFLHPMIKQSQDSISSVENCMKPVISVVHKACIGAGVDLITAADIRYCTKDAFFQVKEVDVGLPADVGTLQRLPKVISNQSIARELCFTARRFDSAEALDIGLVSKVFNDKEEALNSALELASTIASKSPVAVQGTKQNMVYSLSRTTQEGLDQIRLINQITLQGEDFVKAAMAQASKDELPDFDKY